MPYIQCKNTDPEQSNQQNAKAPTIHEVNRRTNESSRTFCVVEKGDVDWLIIGEDN